MTIQEAVKQLKEMRDSQFMPAVFKLYLNKVIETIANEFAPTKDDIYWGYTATIDRPLADKEIVFRLRAIQKQIGGSYAIDRAIEVIEEAQELSERHGHVAGGNKKDVTDTNVGNKGDLIERQAAIDAIFSEPLYKSGMKKRDADTVIPAIYEKIKSLPSAQPEKRTQERTETHSCDYISRQAAIDAADRADYTGLAVEDVKKVTDEVIKGLKQLPPAQPEYEELTPEEAASEIASGSIMSARYWLDAMIQLKQMGYAICRKR